MRQILNKLLFNNQRNCYSLFLKNKSVNQPFNQYRYNRYNNLLITSNRYLSDRRYSEKHEWIRLDTNDKTIGTVGISQYAQEALGDVVYVQLPEIDTEFNQNDEIGAIESVKAANEIYTPVSGKIVDTNKQLEEKPGLVNTSCYDDGWLFRIQISNPKELDGLMDEQAYEEFQKSMH